MSRDQFSIEMPMPHLTLTTNGNGNSNNTSHNAHNSLNSPNPVKSPNARRVAHFSREGILGSAQKARNLSQSSGERESMSNGLQNGNGQSGDDGTNPLKRRSTDGGVDYPRRRATIAVGHSFCNVNFLSYLDETNIQAASVRSAAHASLAVTAPSPSVNCAPNWAQNASTVSLGSN